METEQKSDDVLIDELTEQLIKQTEKEAVFPPSREKGGATGGE